jgi:DNA-binding transcriptional LysR family regulator
MMKYDLHTLRAFIAIADEGSISRAALREHTVPSALSKRVSELEESCGTPLLTRHRRGVALTQAGVELVVHARRVLEELRLLEGAMGEFQSGLRGHVRLLANTSAIGQFLPGDMASFLARNPTIKIDLEERNSEDIQKQVLSGLADLGIMVVNRSMSVDALVCKPYRTDSLCVMMPKAHPLAARKKIRFAETLDFDHIGLPRGSALCELLLDAAADLGKPMRLRIQATGYDGLRRMVASGLGIGVLPAGSVLPFLQADQIDARPLDEPWARRKLMLVSRARSSLTQVARALAEHLEGSADASVRP